MSTVDEAAVLANMIRRLQALEHAVGGLAVPLTSASTLDDLADVDVTPVSDNAVLGYDLGSGLWIPSNEVQASTAGVPSTLTLNPSGGDVKVGSTSGLLRIGDDAYLTDINVAHALGLRSATDVTQGRLLLGNGGTHVSGGSTYFSIGSSSVGYYDTNTHTFRNAAGANFATLDATALTLVSPLRPPAGEGIRFGADGAYIAWHTTGRLGYLQGNSGGLLLNSESGRLGLNGVDGLQLSPFKINGYTGSEGVIGYRAVLSNASGYIFGNYINMTADVVAGYPGWMAGQNGDNYMRWYNMAGVWARTFQANRVEGMNSSTNWSVCGLSTNPGGGTAAISLHPGGVAVMAAAVNGAGNVLIVRDSVFTPGSANVAAAAHTVDSSLRWKKNIAPWPMRSVGAAAERATDVVARLRPITFQRAARDIEVQSQRRTQAWMRLNKYRANRGLDSYELPEHDCAEHDCAGTADEPCLRAIDHAKQHHGFIAEEVIEVVPNAVGLDMEGKPANYDPAQLLSVAIAAIQELTDRIKVLEGA